MSASEGNNMHPSEQISQKPRRQRPKKKFGDGNIRNNQNSEIVDFAPPMRKGNDFPNAQQNVEMKQHPHAARNGPRREEGPKNPKLLRGHERNQPTKSADASVSNIASSLAAIPPHTVDAIVVLAQTLLPPPQMSELIRRLSNAMPKSTGPHRTAQQAMPAGANQPDNAGHKRDDQAPRGGRDDEEHGRGGRGRGGHGRGGRGRGGHGRGGRGRGGNA